MKQGFISLLFFLFFTAQASMSGNLLVETRREIIDKAQTFNTENVYKRFKKEIKEKFDIDDEKIAESLRHEAIRYLILCALYPDKNVNMFNEQIDEFWHTFILFTKDYFNFCNYLGVPYIHHVPNVDSEKPEEGSTFRDFQKLYKETFGQDLPEIWTSGHDSLNCMNGCGGKCGSTCKSCGGPGKCSGPAIEINKCGNCKGGCGTHL